MRRPPKNGEIRPVESKVLLVDGNGLFKVSYFGAKDQYNFKGEHVGGIYSFLTILRKLMSEEIYDKVYVFWDGNLSGLLRYNIYSGYKANRNKNYKDGTHPIDQQELLQRIKIQAYLEELFIRQIVDEVVESDDFIAYYCLNKPQNESVTICTNDRDLCQLIDNKTRVYLLDKKVYINPDNYFEFFGYNYKNLTLIKIITGDSSDNIKGIKGVSLNGLLSLIPELKNFELNITDVKKKCVDLQEERIKNKKTKSVVLDNIINGKSVNTEHKNIYEINDKLINLKKPLITESAKNTINDLISGYMDPSERSFKNVIDMMKKDGLYDIIGHSRITDYLIPFKKLVNRELKNND